MVVQRLLQCGKIISRELNSENSANESAEFVEHTIDSKENYLGPEMVMPLLFR